MNAVAIRELCIRFGDTAALQDINLSIPQGEIYGIIGPDGAGKTTLMRTICTLLPVRQGSVEVLGLSTKTEFKQIRSRIGYMPQRFSLYQDLSVEQNLSFFAKLFGVPRSELIPRRQELYRFSRLEPFAARRAGDLSGGMKQKLALSCALIHTPELIILDEPTFGVDPVSRIEFWNILHNLKAKGIGIIVSTPYMDEAEQCDTVALIHRSRIMRTGSPESLVKAWAYHLYSITGSNLPQIKQFLHAQPEIQALQLFGSEIHASSKAPINTDTLNIWQQQCPAITAWKPINPSMEDVFLEMMHSD